MKLKPKHPAYTGITDFTCPDQVRVIRDMLDDFDSERELAVGVMMSYKTLTGAETKWSKWFPPNDQVASIFVNHKYVFNVLHYADYDGVTQTTHLDEALFWAGKNVHAIQLDMIWPDVRLLQFLKEKKPDLQFIIQVSRKAMERIGNDKHAIASELMRYERAGCLDYALFDMSGGLGIPLNAQILLEYIQQTVSQIPTLSVAVAGGLGPTSMDLLLPIIANGNPYDVSINAQGKLRPSGKADQEPLDLLMAGSYVLAAEVLFRAERP